MSEGSAFSGPGEESGGASLAKSLAAGNPASAGPTLEELAEKLSKLRKHLDQVVVALNAPRDGGVARRHSDGADGGLCCYECGRMGSKDEAGWTLRLCADDELHAFCPVCA